MPRRAPATCPGARACALVALAAAACGGHASAPPMPAGPPASLVATPAGPGDVIVARVDGRPVWGSCVAAQARGRGAKAGLDECIGFELLAQAAERRGLATDRDVVEATRTALVSELVAHAFEDKLTRPGDFGPLWGKLVARARPSLDHPEVRGSAYARVVVPARASPAADAAAHATADRIAAALSGEVGLTTPDFFELAQRAAGGAKLETSDVPLHLQRWFAPAYGDALFAIPEIGRTSPVVRTKWGWDVILWTSVLPAAHPSEAELEQRLLPEVKRSYFLVWVGQLQKQLGIHVQIVHDNVAKLEALP